MLPTRDETALWIALNQIQRLVYRTIDSKLKAKGLPPLRWYDVLWAIEMAGDCGSRAYEMKKNLLFDQSNLSRLLRRIVDAGLVEETTFEGDRRGKVLRITDKGKSIRNQMWQVYGPAIHHYMSRAAAVGDVQTTTELLRRIYPLEGQG